MTQAELCARQQRQWRLMFPFHWATFDLALHPWVESIQMAAHMAAENDIERVATIMGEKVIAGVSSTCNWWKIPSRDK